MTEIKNPYQPSTPARLANDREMGRKLYTLGKKGVCLNWQENALLKSAGMRLRELANEVEDLRKEVRADDDP
ncbi:MAG: hypothetical protein IKN76_05785 [Oscillospiraceae bacterium]|nr:hypothetical protein [Clostridia bacterium]MBR3545562.1 hypothetical protein [Oscillospiraceae bacterium]